MPASGILASAFALRPTHSAQARESAEYDANPSSAGDVCQFLSGFVLHRNINERQSGAAEGLIFAKDQREIASDLSISQGNGRQHLGANIFLNVRARDKADPDIGSHETLQPFAAVQVYGTVRLPAF